MKRFPFLALLLQLALYLPARGIDGATGAEPTKSQWQGFERLDFKVGDRAAILVKPASAAEGHPWIWRTEFFGHEPQADLALLAAGWHVAFFQVSNHNHPIEGQNGGLAPEFMRSGA